MSDRDRFQREVLVWLDAAYRAALALTGQPARADDLAQTALLKAWERFNQFRPGTNAKAWLLTILRNAWIDQLRGRRDEQAGGGELLDTLAADPEQPDPPPWHDIASRLEQFADGELAAAVAALPEPFRLALFLVDVEGFNHAEAAEVLGVAVGTAKSRASRARQMVRDRLARRAAESQPNR